jgi:DNA-binding beta-propeller fold protein YncE
MCIPLLLSALVCAAAQTYTLQPGFGSGLPTGVSQVTAVAVISPADPSQPAELVVAQRGTSEPPFLVLDAGSGAFIRSYGKFGVTLKSPHGIAPSANRSELWVTDIVNGTVLKLNPATGDVLELLGSHGKGTAPPQFSAPADIAVGPGGALWVSDGDGGTNNRVMRLSSLSPPDAPPAYVLGCGHNGTSPGCFSSPHSVAFAGELGHVWVADRGNNRLQAFAGDTGKQLGEWAAADGCFVPPGVAPGGQQPWSVRVDNKRRVLFVADGGPAGNPAGGEPGAVYVLRLGAGPGWSKTSIGSCKGQLLQTLTVPNQATAKRA